MPRLPPSLIIARAGLLMATLARAESAAALKPFIWVAPARPIPLARSNMLFTTLRDLPVASLACLRERVHSSAQRIGPATVRGSWLRSIDTDDGLPVFRAGARLETVPADLVARAALVQARLPGLRLAMDNESPPGRHFTPRLELVAEGTNQHFEWTLEGLTPDETHGFRVRFDEFGHRLELREAGMHLQDGVADVFPKGPLDSRLANVVLQQLDGTGTLSSPLLQATSARADAQVKSDSHRFEYSPSDPRFDPVQAYFFADQMLRWMQSRFGYEPGDRLEIKVQVGERSNAAFYLHHQIRLGEGDNLRYRMLARDPSIVMHEVVHAVVDSYARLPAEGEGGGLNEAFADFFAASFLDRPEIGAAASVDRPYARTLQNTLSAEELNADAGTYAAARIIGGTFWELRQRLGRETGETLAYRALMRLGPGAGYADLVPALLMAAPGLLSPAQVAQAQGILRERGWKF